MNNRTTPVFKDAVTIITGAASGIGREMAYQLAEQGACLSLADCDAEGLENVAAECRSRGCQAIAVQTDVCQQAQCTGLIQDTVTAYAKIDMLINNAGTTMYTNFEKISNLSLFEDLMRVNYFGSVYCTYYSLPYLRKTHGRVVAISSLAGKLGLPTRTGYAASKHAMIGFFDSLRIELDGCGISITVACPGFVATEIRKRALGADGNPLGKNPVPQKNNMMSAQDCARIILRAAAKRKREVIMTWQGKIGLWLKLIAPGWLDWAVRKYMSQSSTEIYVPKM
jgi:short-subunit dehydrogenase